MKHSLKFLQLVNEAKSKIKECSVIKIKEMNENKILDGFLIDVREELEVSKGYIPNSIHLSKGIIESRIENLIPNKNQKMYFYCGGGFRSALVADIVQKMGYKNVFSIAGGWREWNKNKYPIQKSKDSISLEYIKLIKFAKSKIPEISADELYNKYINNNLDGTIIDVREYYEFTKFHIPGAIHLSKGEIEVKIENIILNNNQKIYLYCSLGYRSLLAGLNLQKMGYKNVYSMNKGIKEGWLVNNYPISQY